MNLMHIIICRAAIRYSFTHLCNHKMNSGSFVFLLHFLLPGEGGLNLSQHPYSSIKQPLLVAWKHLCENNLTVLAALFIKN